MKNSSTHYYIYIAMLAAMSAGCADEEMYIAEAPIRIDQVQSLKRSQGIGYGFDASGSIIESEYFTENPVIDLAKMQEKYGALGQDEKLDIELYNQLFSDEARYYTDLDIYTGSTLKEISAQETREVFDDDTFLGFGSYYMKRENFNQYKLHEDIVSKLQIKHIVRSCDIDMGIVDYFLSKGDSSVLCGEFLASVNTLCKDLKGIQNVTYEMVSPFCQKWGTHLVSMANLGGIMDYTLIIERDSCYNSKEVTSWIGEKAFGISVNESLHSQIHQTLENSNQIKFSSWLDANGGNKSLLRELKNIGTTTDKKTIKELDTDLSSKFEEWVKSINDKSDESDNTVIVSGRMIPYYQLFTDLERRSILVKVFKAYLNKTAPASELDEPKYGYIDVVKNSKSVIQEPCVYIAEDSSCIICTEYVPAIRPDRPCMVAYPLIVCNDQKVGERTKRRAFFDSGYFLGDKDHRPGKVKWYGNDSHYEPSDSLWWDSPSESISSLFDRNTYSLKRIYTYWNNVHPLPDPTKKSNEGTEDEPKEKTIGKLQDGGMEYAKVGGTVYSRKPVTFDENEILTVTGNLEKAYGSEFSNFLNKITIEYVEDEEFDRELLLRHYLIEGGNMPQATNRLTIVNNNLNLYGVMDQLPMVEETYGLARFLGGRTDIVFDAYSKDGGNMLGLLWPKGYRAISKNPDPNNPSWLKLDDQALLILSTTAGPNNTKEIRAMRLGRSGMCYPFDYEEYVSSFNYSSSDYYRYAPLFFVKRTY